MRDLRLTLLGCLLVLVNQCCTMEYFSATADMGKAVDIGKQLASDLNEYLTLEEARLSRIRRAVDRLSSENPDSLPNTNPEEFYSNPVNAYIAVSRLAYNWKSELLGLIDSTFNHSLDEQSLRVSSNEHSMADVRARVEEHASMLPGNDDLNGAADAIIRLQQTYRLPVERFADGKLLENHSTLPLTATQCFHIGRKAYEENDFLRAEEWFRMAYQRLWEERTGQLTSEQQKAREQAAMEEFLPETTVVAVLDYLSYALGRQGRYEEALNVTKMILHEDPTNERARSNEEFYVQRIGVGEGRVGPAPPPEKMSAFDLETETYQAVCRGEQRFAPPPTYSVYCRYHRPHPYYLIGPIKEEVVHPDPKLVMWYDVIHESEIQRLKELAGPRLRRATVKNPVTGKLEFAFYRTSKSAWLPENMDEMTHRINKRISAMTGLSMDTAEDLQVGNYGIGGYYAPHFDFGRKREKDAFEAQNGNRIATIIFYMSEVPAGGGTAFNRIGALVPPVYKAAGFWYNLYPSGEGDLRTRHAACPVLVGSKWVMNVWFHERGQEFIRPCELEQGTIEVDDGS